MESSSCGGSVVIEPARRRRARIVLRLFAEKHACLHRLAQRVDRGVRDLRGVDEQPVPVDRQRRWGCPWRKAARRPWRPAYRPRGSCQPDQFAFSRRQQSVFHDLERARRADAPRSAGSSHIWLRPPASGLSLGVISVDAVGALLFADAAAACIAASSPDHLKLRVAYIR